MFRNRFQSLVELSRGLKKSWMRGTAELARETDWNCTGRTLCFNVLWIFKCSFFSLLNLTLQYGQTSISHWNWKVWKVKHVITSTFKGGRCWENSHCRLWRILRNAHVGTEKDYINFHSKVVVSNRQWVGEADQVAAQSAHNLVISSSANCLPFSPLRSVRGKVASSRIHLGNQNLANIM